MNYIFFIFSGEWTALEKKTVMSKFFFIELLSIAFVKFLQ